MIKIEEKKKEILKDLNTSMDVYRFLEKEIKNAIIENKLKMPIIINILSKELNKNLSLDTLKRFVAENKKRWLKERRIEEMKKVTKTKEFPKKEKKFILFANDKGGVGKTTLATLLNLPNSLILNLDKTREIEDIYPFKTIVDYGKVEEEENIELEDFMEILNQDDSFQNIIIDTKGGITESLIKIIPYVNSVVIPIKVGAVSEKPSYEFIVNLKNYLDELNNNDVSWGIVYNEISPKFLKKTGIGKYELLDDFKEIEKQLKENILGDLLKVITYFKRSEAITTREKEGKDVEELMKKNFGAYLVIKKEIERLNNELKPVLY